MAPWDAGSEDSPRERKHHRGGKKHRKDKKHKRDKEEKREKRDKKHHKKNKKHDEVDNAQLEPVEFIQNFNKSGHAKAW
eukprot:CAMPEP_0168352304 /NCGR_PEP_ID=MMETSP0213-20121227/22469_1 /TAXON_ID=151035 /ORGANISM="Euplotes harpa, Strain FSP1.4" /LENGTH=78 /DNA_ID=CAMNT_0008363485 /DNA_START=298 /DNA_END=531 /DNA_ORIENTATION=+